MLKILSFFTIITIFVSGCAYKTKKIFLDKATEFSYMDDKKNLELTIKAVNLRKSDSYFENFILLHMQIKNKNNESYILYPQKMGLQIASLDQLREKVPSAILSYFIPTFLFITGGILFLWQLCFPLAASSGILSILLCNNNRKTTIKNLQKITFLPSQRITIEAFSTINKLIFIKLEDYTPNFDVVLVSKETGIPVKFNVSVVARNDFIYRFN